MSENIVESQKYTDRDFIESILNSYFIVDYGFITKVNADKTVNVMHAKKQTLKDGSELPATETLNIEVLTFSCKAISFNVDYAQGDKVLLLGLKDYVEKVSDVTKSESASVWIHYKRDNLKALPLCLFDEEAKIKVEAKDGSLKIDTCKNTEITCGENVKIDSKKIELNGNSKQLVTWAELDDALQPVWKAIKLHTHASFGAPSAGLETIILNIGAAKTTSIVTGG